jgi:hypothetical protein
MDFNTNNPYTYTGLTSGTQFVVWWFALISDSDVLVNTWVVPRYSDRCLGQLLLL